MDTWRPIPSIIVVVLGLVSFPALAGEPSASSPGAVIDVDESRVAAVIDRVDHSADPSAASGQRIIQGGTGINGPLNDEWVNRRPHYLYPDGLEGKRFYLPYGDFSEAAQGEIGTTAPVQEANSNTIGEGRGRRTLATAQETTSTRAAGADTAVNQAFAGFQAHDGRRGTDEASMGADGQEAGGKPRLPFFLNPYRGLRFEPVLSARETKKTVESTDARTPPATTPLDPYPRYIDPEGRVYYLVDAKLVAGDRTSAATMAPEWIPRSLRAD